MCYTYWDNGSQSFYGPCAESDVGKNIFGKARFQ